MVRAQYSLLKETVHEFIEDNVMKLSASLAYYTIFSIGPLLLVIISLTGLFFETAAVTGKIYDQIKNLVGANGADQVLKIISNMQHEQTAAKYSIIGFAVLIFGATTIFADIQDSINYIWSIRAKPQKGWVKYLKNRLLSFSLIVGIGFLMMASLLVSTVVDLLTGKLLEFFSTGTVVVFKIVNMALLFLIVSFLFSVIYKVLPDARIRWKDAFIGALFTSLLFLLGKFLIGVYLTYSNFSTYGAAASIIVILTWVYYTSTILYFGAEFTKVYAIRKGGGIRPYTNAVYILKRETKELEED